MGIGRPFSSKQSNKATYHLHAKNEQALAWKPDLSEEVSILEFGLSKFDGESLDGDDELNITPDVNAFASLISSRALKPPLSIGLFGDWGSGKSFFMGKLKKAIEENVSWVKKEQEAAATESNQQLEELWDQFLQAKNSLSVAKEAEATAIQVQLTKIEKEIRECLFVNFPKPKHQAKQIREWFKVTDSWAYDSLVKVYGQDHQKVREKFRLLKTNPQNALGDLEEEIEQEAPKFIQKLIQTNDFEKIKKLNGHLAEAKREKELGFCRYVSQIEFNAWHYVDTNLWASLINHIFEALNKYVGNLPEDEKERIKLYRTLENTQEMMRQKNSELEAVEKEIQEMQEALEILEAERREQRRTLQNIEAKDIWYVLKEQSYVKSASLEIERLIKSVRDQFGVKVAAELGMVQESKHLQELTEAHQRLSQFAQKLTNETLETSSNRRLLAKIEKELQVFVKVLQEEDSFESVNAARQNLIEMAQGMAIPMKKIDDIPIVESEDQAPAANPFLTEEILEILTEIKEEVKTIKFPDHTKIKVGPIAVGIPEEFDWRELKQSIHHDLDAIGLLADQETDLDALIKWNTYVDLTIEKLSWMAQRLHERDDSLIKLQLRRVKERVKDLKEIINFMWFKISLGSNLFELNQLIEDKKLSKETFSSLNDKFASLLQQLSILITIKDPIEKIDLEKTREQLEKLLSHLEMAFIREDLKIKLATLSELAKTTTLEGNTTLKEAIESHLEPLQKLIDSKDPLSQLDLKVRENRVKVEALIQCFTDSRVKLFEAFNLSKKMSPKQLLLLGILVVLPIVLLIAQPSFSFLGFKGEIASIIDWAVEAISAGTALGYSTFKVIPGFISRLQNGLKKVDQGIHILQQAQVQLQQLEDRASMELDQSIEKQKLAIEAKRKEQGEKRVKIRELQQKREALELEVKDIERGQRFSSFVEERLKSADYKKHLGLISIIRNDFEKLTSYLHQRGLHSRFVTQFSQEGASEESATIPEMEKVEIIDRIILYIDDLDRCPPDKVVEVLQAIHLILAFPLFVVVVGVDVRWVSKSLVKKYGSMLISNKSPMNKEFSPIHHSPTTNETTALTLHFKNNATPFDYLEKIFQIPFRLKVMDEHAKRTFIGKLLEKDVLREKADSNEPQPSTKTTITGQDSHQQEAERDTSSSILIEGAQEETRQDKTTSTNTEDDDSSTTISRSFNPISLSPEEYNFVQFLSPLLTGSPRTIKRFVNICRLIKSHNNWGSDIPLGNRGMTEYMALIFILAVITGQPILASLLFDWLGDATLDPSKRQQHLIDFVETLKQSRQWDTLDEDIKEKWRIFYRFLTISDKDADPKFLEQIQHLTVEEIDKLTGIAARFSFRFDRY